MTTSQLEDHRLAAGVDDAIATLREVPSKFVRLGDTHHVLHDEYAERAVSLSRYLQGAIELIRQGLYSPGYALMRCALEHHLVDQLFMRADRYMVQGPLSEDTYLRWREQWENGEPGTETIVDMSRNAGGHTKIVRRGPHVKEADGTVAYGLSIYLGYLEKFDPLLGPPTEQRYMEVSWRHLAVLEEQAVRQQRLYGEAFRWKSVCDNLELNGMYTGEDRIRLNVHYRFLSGFVHLTPRSDKIVQRMATSVVPVLEAERDHPARELGHLYAGAIAGRELRILVEMADAPPQVSFIDRKELEDAAAEALTVSRHLWFPGDPPHPYDLWNLRSWERWRRPGDPSGEDIGVNEPYYRNPFDRLKDLHRPQRMGNDEYIPVFFLPGA